MSIPTILIPGIKCTNLVNSNTLNFSSVYNSLTFDNTCFKLKDDGITDEDDLAIVIPSDVVDLPYKDFTQYFKKSISDTLFLFGYDWRKSNEFNGKELLKYVKELSRKLNINEFNFISHSMGGNLFTSFLSTLNGDYSIINKSVIVAAPFLGTAEAISVLTKGTSFLFDSKEEFRKAARTFPSVYEMLPLYPEVVKKETKSLDIFAKQAWQQSVRKTSMFQEKLNRAKQFHENLIDLKSLPESVRNRFLIITGTGEETVWGVTVKDDDHNTFEFINTLKGDGTIPDISTTYFKDSIVTLQFVPKVLWGVPHALIMSQSVVKNCISRFFLGKTEKEQWWNDAGKNVIKL